ncbi:MAG: Flp family type IVb pilin [Chakrabartia sp.]
MFFNKKASKKSQKGAAMIEYALIAALIAVAVMGTLSSVGSKANTKFSGIATQLN